MREFNIVGGYRDRKDAERGAEGLSRIGYIVAGVFQDDAGFWRIQVVRD